MSLENAKQFLQKAASDTNLNARLTSGELDADAAVALGAEMGLAFNVDDLSIALDELYGDLSEEELEGTTGAGGGIQGTIRIPGINSINTSGTSGTSTN